MFKAPNFTLTPNDLFDKYLSQVEGSQFKVLAIICRQTFGWQKRWDCISLTQLQKKTGLSRPTIIKATKNLISKNLIIQRKTGTLGQQKTYYALSVENPPDDPSDEDEFSNNSYLVKTFNGGWLNGFTHKRKPIYSKEKKIDKRKETPKRAPASLSPSTSSPPPKILSLGEYKNIKITQEHYDDLIKKHGQKMVKEVIAEGDCWLEENGKKKKNYKAFLQNWIRRRSQFKKPSTREEIKEKTIRKNSDIYNSLGTQLKESGTLDKLGVRFHIGNDKVFGYTAKVFKNNYLKETIPLSENGFRDQLMNALAKCGYGSFDIKKFIAPKTPID